MIFPRRWQDRVVAYHEGDLPRADRARLEAHLHACVPCRELLRKLEETDSLLLGSRPVVELLAARSSQAILAQALAESGAARQSGRRTFGMWTFAASAVCLFAAGTAGIYRPALAPEPHPSASKAAFGSVSASPVRNMEPLIAEAAPTAGRRPHRSRRPRRFAPVLVARDPTPPLAVPGGIVDGGVRALADAALGHPQQHRMHGSLLVSVENAASPLEVAVEVNELPDEAPGQACASSAHQDAYGRVTQKEVRVSSSLNEPQVTLIGQAPEPSPTN